MIDINFLFLRDCLDRILNDIQMRQITDFDQEFLILLDTVYPRFSYAYQRINNYIINKEDNINV